MDLKSKIQDMFYASMYEDKCVVMNVVMDTTRCLSHKLRMLGMLVEQPVLFHTGNILSIITNLNWIPH